MNDSEQTKPNTPEFDFSSFPDNTLFHDRREGRERRGPRPAPRGIVTPPMEPRAPSERRAKKERRRRIDPTTFEKQYTDDELEFMNAMQRYKVQSGKSFPTHGDVLRVAFSLGYRKLVTVDDDEDLESEHENEVVDHSAE
jgi:hypothetical protein